MTKVNKTAKSTDAKAVWKRPELRRMSAGGAESAFAAASDGATQNS